MNREERNIIFNEAKRAVRILKPENVNAVAAAVASKIISDAASLNRVEFLTSDATPFEVRLTVPEYCVGQIEYSLSIALPAASEAAFYRGVWIFKVYPTSFYMASGSTLITFSPSGALTGAAQSIAGSGTEIIITFEGLAATDIQGLITYNLEVIELKGIAL